MKLISRYYRPGTSGMPRMKKKSEPEFDAVEILALAIAVDREQGFVKSGFGYTVTNDPDTGAFLPDEQHYKIEDNKTRIHQHLSGQRVLSVTDADKEKAGIMIEHFKGIALKKLTGKTSDFENSVLKYIDAEKIDRLGVAIFASLPKVYSKDVETRNLLEQAENSEFVGTLHKRCTFTLEVKQVYKHNANIVTCVENGRNIVKFFSDEDFTVGDVLTVAGYVKDQYVSKFTNLKETMLNRVKVKG